MLSTTESKVSFGKKVPFITPINSSTAVYKLGDYVIGKTIGIGTFGKVKVANNRETNHVAAVKFMCRQKIRKSRMAEKIMQEIFNHYTLHHPHIIELYAAISCPTHIILVMEFAGCGDLFDYIVTELMLSEKESRRLFQQIISAVDYLHRHQIIHRDLKPENILLTEPGKNAKLADFGLSMYLEDGELQNTSCGSPNYASPEVVSGSLYVGPEVDIWSTGVILYTMLNGTLPFADSHLPNLFKKIKTGIFQLSNKFSPDLVKLIKHTLAVDPRKRATVTDILNNPWFRVDLPASLFAPVTKQLSDSVMNGQAIEAVSELLGIEEKQVMNAVLQRKNSDNRRICHQVEKIAEWFGSETKRIPSKKNSVLTNGNKPSKVRWYLGIRSSSSPTNIMLKLYDSLKLMNFEWHTVTPYHLIVRPMSISLEETNKIHIDLNLYQIRLPSAGFVVDFRLLSTQAAESQTCSATSSLPSRSGTFSSNSSSPIRKKSFAFNEIFRNRASSYEYLKKARENALKIVAKRWQSYSDEMQVSSPSLAERLQKLHLANPLDENSDTSSNNEAQNFQSELLRFFDYCAKLIVELLKTE